MAIRTFNSVGGFSVGETPETIILANGDITTDYATFTANVAAGNVLTNNLLYANGVPWDFISAGGLDTQIQFNDGGELGGVANFAFDKTSNTLTLLGTANITKINTSNVVSTGNITAPYFIGNVIGNISGTITVPGNNTAVLFNNTGNADASDNLKFNFATNVLTVTGNVEATYFKGNGSELTNINGGNVSEVANAGYATIAGTAYAVDGSNVSGNVSTAVTAYNAYSVDGANVNGTVSSASVAYSVDGSNVSGNVATAVTAYTAYSVDGGNVSGQVGNALVAGTVYTNAQPNITSVGTLTSLTVSGNVGASYFVGNGAQLTNITGGNVDGQVGNALIAGTVYTNAQPNITSVGTLTNLDVSGNATVTGNLTVSGTTTYINVSELSINDPIISLGGSNSGGNASVYDGKDRGVYLRNYKSGSSEAVNMFMGWDTGNGEFALGSNVAVSGEVVTFNDFGNVRLNTVIGNLSGQVLTASQTGITTVGTLTDLTVAGNLQVNTAANVNTLTASGISYPTTDGTAGQVMSTYGNGVLYFSTISTSSITNGTSNIAVQNNGNINLTSAGNTSLVVTATGVNVSGTINSTGSATVGNVIIGNTSVRATTVETTSATKSSLVTLSATGNRAVEFFVKGEESAGGKYSVATVSAVHNGSAVDYAVYGTVILGGATGSLEVNYAAGSITLDVTPASSNSTFWTIQYRTI